MTTPYAPFVIITTRFFPHSWFIVFVLSYYVSLRSEYRVVISDMISTLNLCLIRHLPPVVCSRIVVSNTYCVVLCFIFFFVLCSYVSSFSGFSIVWLSFRNYLMFIYNQVGSKSKHDRFNKWSGNCLSIRSTRVIPLLSGVRVAQCLFCGVLSIVVCFFVLFLLTIALSVLLWFTASDYPVIHSELDRT